MQFGKIANLHRPVVHLEVDIDGVLAVPHGHELVVPDALEIKSRAALPAAGDNEVPPHLEIQRRQPRIFLAVPDRFQPLVGVCR